MKKRRPQPYWGGDNSGNALEASNALNYRVWGIPAVLSTGIPGKALRAFPVSFRHFSGISSGKSQPYCWGNGSIYLNRSGPLLENGLDRPENRYGRYGFASCPSIFISTVGVDGARDSL